SILMKMCGSTAPGKAKYASENRHRCYNGASPYLCRSFPTMDEKERARALDLALGQIEKQFGKGSILRLGSKDAIVPVSAISTGSISVDADLGVGGLPRDRVCEIYGTECC